MKSARPSPEVVAIAESVEAVQRHFRDSLPHIVAAHVSSPVRPSATEKAQVWFLVETAENLVIAGGSNLERVVVARFCEELSRRGYGELASESCIVALASMDEHNVHACGRRAPGDSPSPPTSKLR